jgi:hypothetical protein
MAPALEPYLLQSPMRAERRDVDHGPDRKREQQAKPGLGAIHHESASSSSPIGSPAPSGALGPIFRDGTFEYIPIPEAAPTRCSLTYATLPGLLRSITIRLSHLHM